MDDSASSLSEISNRTVKTIFEVALDRPECLIFGERVPVRHRQQAYFEEEAQNRKEQEHDRGCVALKVPKLLEGQAKATSLRRVFSHHSCSKSSESCI